MEAEQRLQLLHDISKAIQTLRLLCDSLETGYRFDDETAPLKIAHLRKMIDPLEVGYRLVYDTLRPIR